MSMINYAESIYNATVNANCGDLYVSEAIELLASHLKRVDRVFLIGNGGSGACCDHMANDLCLAGIRSQSLTNTNNITCIGNDFGFESIFTKQLEWLSSRYENSMLVAFSCSGKSKNIINAAQWAKVAPVFTVVTFTGFSPDNPLRNIGHLNFHVPSNSYGVVQLAHEALMHCAIDKIAGLC